MGTQVSRGGRKIAVRHASILCSQWVLVSAISSLVALAVVAPFFILGNASGHDFEFHLASWMEVAQQWREGIFYPRWAALANWGFGEPRFIFYPPASWMLGAALSFVFPWNMVPGAFIWIALTIAGTSMFALAKEWLSQADAVAAAVLFAVNPCHLLVVYWRSDFAELLVSAVIPLAVLFAMRTASTGWAAVIPLALVTATVWLGNAPAAVIVTYSVALLLGILAAHGRSIWPVIYGGTALALGFALAAFFIVPAAFEQRWVNISEVLSSGLRFSDNFLFAHTADPEHDRFNSIASAIAFETIAATVSAVGIFWRWWREQRALCWVLLAFIVVSSVLMLPITSPVWAHAPELGFVQFPWRWLLALDVPFALAIAAAMARLSPILKRSTWAFAVVGLAITGLLLTRTNWWDAGGPKDIFESNFSTGAGYLGTDEYSPRGSDHYDLQQGAPLVSLREKTNALESRASVQIQDWGLERKNFVIHSREASTAVLRLDDYPAWRVQINGKSGHRFAAPTGQMLVPLPAGTSQVQITFATTPDRVWGGVISVLAALAVFVAVLVHRIRLRQTKS
jgi:hypothetical protein